MRKGVVVAVLGVAFFFLWRRVSPWGPGGGGRGGSQPREEGAPPLETHSINLLVPLATMVGDRQDHFRLSPTVTRAVLDGIATRLDERRELTRSLTGLLIFLGLLRPFCGLLESLAALARP